MYEMCARDISGGLLVNTSQINDGTDFGNYCSYSRYV